MHCVHDVGIVGRNVNFDKCIDFVIHHKGVTIGSVERQFIRPISTFT